MKKENMKNVFILAFIIVSIFSYLDAMQIIPWQQTQQWETYTQYVVPAILGMWTVALLGISIMYYLIKKDMSEAIGIFIAAKIMMIGGLQDLMFFVLSPNIMTNQMCWFTGPQTFVSSILGECCVSPLGLTLNAILAVVLAWFTLKYFFKLKW